MNNLVVDINLPREEYLKVYQTFVRQVRVTARNGQTVRFPVTILAPFLTHLGIVGTFRLSFDENYKFSGIEKI